MLVRAECAVISGGAVRCGSKTAALIRNKILIYSNTIGGPVQKEALSVPA